MSSLFFLYIKDSTAESRRQLHRIVALTIVTLLISAMPQSHSISQKYKMVDAAGNVPNGNPPQGMADDEGNVPNGDQPQEKPAKRQTEWDWVPDDPDNEEPKRRLPPDFSRSPKIPAEFVNTQSSVIAMINDIVRASGLGADEIRGPQVPPDAPDSSVAPNEPAEAETSNTSQEENDQTEASASAKEPNQDAAPKVAPNLDHSPTPTVTPGFGLYMDIEGDNLGRNGSITIIQIHEPSARLTYIIDVFKLKALAFRTSGAHGTTLKELFESRWIPKILFDLRNDADGLFANYQVKLEGAEDLQLMELASREDSTQRGADIIGLRDCLERDAGLSRDEMTEMVKTKSRGRNLMNDYSDLKPFNRRPMRTDVWNYCIRDVLYLPKLRREYWDRLDPTWQRIVLEESAYRAKTSRESWYDPDGYGKKLSPCYLETNDALVHGTIITPAQPDKNRYPAPRSPTPKSPLM